MVVLVQTEAPTPAELQTLFGTGTMMQQLGCAIRQLGSPHPHTLAAGAGSGASDAAPLTAAEVEAIQQVKAKHATSTVATDNVWIVKPTHLSKGAGIQCFRDLPELLSHAKAQDFKVVAQRYVAKPLVIHNKKVLLHQAFRGLCKPSI